MNARGNTAFSINTPFKKNVKTPVFFIEKALGWKIYLDKVLANEEKLHQLKALDYAKQDIENQYIALKQLIDSLENYHVLVERKKQLNSTKTEVIEDINRDYIYHKNLIANLFNLPRQIVQNNNGPVMQLEDAWLKEVSSFYSQLLQNETALHKLKALNVKEDTLTSHVATLDVVKKILLEVDEINLELDKITGENAEKKALITDWITAFKKVNEEIDQTVNN